MGEVVKFISKVEVEKRAFVLALDCLFTSRAVGEDKSLNKQKKIFKITIDHVKKKFETDCPEHKKFAVCFEEIAQAVFCEFLLNESFRTEVSDLFKNRIEEIKAEFSNYWANAGT